MILFSMMVFGTNNVVFFLLQQACPNTRKLDSQEEQCVRVYSLPFHSILGAKFMKNSHFLLRIGKWLDRDRTQISKWSAYPHADFSWPRSHVTPQTFKIFARAMPSKFFLCNCNTCILQAVPVVLFAITMTGRYSKKKQWRMGGWICRTPNILKFVTQFDLFCWPSSENLGIF